MEPKSRRLSRLLDVPPTVRLVVPSVVGIAVALSLTWSSVVVAVMAGWAVTATLFVLWTALVIVPMDAESTAEHATREVPSRVAAHGFVLAASTASLIGVGLVLVGAAGKQRPLALAAVLLSVGASWAAIHMLFALRYARMYYLDSPGGIDFHQDELPRYTDFTYVSITVGMSFAISDTDLSDSSMRRTAQLHGLLSYLFGTVILAVLVNLVAGLSA